MRGDKERGHGALFQVQAPQGRPWSCLRGGLQQWLKWGAASSGRQQGTEYPGEVVYNKKHSIEAGVRMGNTHLTPLALLFVTFGNAGSLEYTVFVHCNIVFCYFSMEKSHLLISKCTPFLDWLVLFLVQIEYSKISSEFW